MLGMVEKVARAICRSMLQDPDIDYEVHHQDGLVKGWKMYEMEARAAIQAMRDPTGNMVDAGCFCQPSPFGDASSVWKAMIDAALSEE